MSDNTPNSKFDERIKNVLDNHETPYDSSDWTRMESMLDSAPKSNTFNVKYFINAAVVVAVCVGAYFIYSILSDKTVAPPSNTEIINDATEQPELNKEEVLPATESIVSSPTQEAEESTKEEEKALPVIVKSEDAFKINKEKEPILKKDKTIKSITKPEDENVKIHTVVEMGNEPIFGDMIDSSKGIIGNTKEKEETKKAAKSQTTPIGWNEFMLSNVNPDSIRKHREKMKNDTLKK